MQENLAGVRVVKAFVRAPYENQRFKTANEDLVERTIRIGQLMAIIMPLISLFLNLGIVGVVWFGGNLVIAGGLKVGQVMAFVNYLSQMLWSLLMAGMLLIRVSRAEASAQRILEVLDMQPHIQDRAGAARAGRARAGGLRERDLQLRRQPGRGVERDQPGGRTRADGGHPGRDRLGQIQPGASDPALL